MKIRNIDEINDFLATVESCVGEVYLTSIYGDKFCLKSCVSRYIALGALLGERGEELELFCECKEDEYKFRNFFRKHQQVLFAEK